MDYRKRAEHKLHIGQSGLYFKNKSEDYRIAQEIREYIQAIIKEIISE